jgi:hypothetical protein
MNEAQEWINRRRIERRLKVSQMKKLPRKASQLDREHGKLCAKISAAEKYIESLIKQIERIAKQRDQLTAWMGFARKAMSDAIALLDPNGDGSEITTKANSTANRLCELLLLTPDVHLSVLHGTLETIRKIASGETERDNAEDALVEIDKIIRCCTTAFQDKMQDGGLA